MSSRTVLNLVTNGNIWFAERDQTNLDQKSAPAPEKTLVVPFDIPEIDTALPQGGLPRGTVHEWFWSKNFPYPPQALLTHLALKAIAKPTIVSPPTANPLSTKIALWIGKECWPSPLFLQQKEDTTQDLFALRESLLFIDPPTQKLRLWAISAALASPAVGVVVAAVPNIQMAATRRLAIAAKRGGALGLLIRPFEEQRYTSAAASRWLCEPTLSCGDAQCWQVKIIRWKGPQPRAQAWVIVRLRSKPTYDPTLFATAQDEHFSILPDVVSEITSDIRKSA
jgi:hypothetical protein